MSFHTVTDCFGDLLIVTTFRSSGGLRSISCESVIIVAHGRGLCRLVQFGFEAVQPLADGFSRVKECAEVRTCSNYQLGVVDLIGGLWYPWKPSSAMSDATYHLPS